MSNNASLKRTTAEFEATKAKYADARKQKPADQFIREINQQFEKVEKLHPAPDEIFTEMVDKVGFAKAVPLFRQEMIGRRVRDTAALDLIFAQWGSALYGGKIEKPARARPTKPKSKRMESLARRMARIKREMDQEAEAVALVEQRGVDRFIARIARETTMHELWRLTTAKLGKRNDHKNRAIDNYSEAVLAKYKIAFGEA